MTQVPLLRRIAVVVAALMAGGCGESTEPPPEADCSSLADTLQAATVSFQNDIVPFFADNRYGCNAIGCHGSSFPGSPYLLASYNDLFIAGPQAINKGLCSVRPGAPDESYIIWKIDGRSDIEGARMPNVGAPMTSQDITTFRQWILEGARNN